MAGWIRSYERRWLKGDLIAGSPSLPGPGNGDTATGAVMPATAAIAAGAD